MQQMDQTRKLLNLTTIGDLSVSGMNTVKSLI